MRNEDEVRKQKEATAWQASEQPHAASLRIISLQKPPRKRAWKSILKFILQAAVGGALGSYFLSAGFGLYNYSNPWIALLVIIFPVYMLFGAGVGFLTGPLILGLENLLEDKFGVVARMIVAILITTLIAVGLGAIQHPVDAELLKLSFFPGFVLGVPIGLIAGSRFRLWRTLAHGVEAESLTAEEFVQQSVSLNPALGLLSFLGGLALRLVSASGLMVSVMVLACCWKFQKREEILVTIFAIYYFASTAYLSFTQQRRWVLLTAGPFLNALLFVVVRQWDTAAVAARPGPLMIAFLVLTFVWILFIAGLRPARRIRVVAGSNHGAYSR